jgi:hypothetical protein
LRSGVIVALTQSRLPSSDSPRLILYAAVTVARRCNGSSAVWSSGTKKTEKACRNLRASSHDQLGSTFQLTIRPRRSMRKQRDR